MIFRMLALMVALGVSVGFGTVLAVEPKISDIRLEPDGRARVTIAADASSYYVLYRGEVVTDIRLVSQLGLGAADSVQLTDSQAPAPAAARFYRVEQVPLSAPKDSDGDGIDDVYELQRRAFLDPLVKINPAQDTDADGVADLEEYRQNTDPAAANSVAPTVSLIAPTLGAAYFAPGYVTFAATAQAKTAGATVAKVEFFANTNKVGEGTPITVAGGTQYEFKWDAVPLGDYVLSARVTDSKGASAESIPSTIRVVNLTVEPLTTLSSSPAAGESGVAVTRETVLRFSCPLRDDAHLSLNGFNATANGRQILSRVELSTDHRTATLFYLENLPSSTRVRVTFDGTGVYDCLGRAIDADGDGEAGGVALIEFDTLATVEVARTAVIGRVFASEPVPGATGTNFVNRPLKGVTITVDGAEETLRAVTDAQGGFRLEPAPAGRFFVHVDGRTAEGSQWPSGAYYPFVGKAWDAVAGSTINLAGGTGEIYLPLVPGDALKAVSPTDDTKIGFSATILSNNPALAGVSITVPANSLFADNGARGGRVGIAPVAPDRLPEPLPAGLAFPLVITIQTDGPSNFDRPVPVCFPNLPDPGTGQPLPPGTKNWLFSFSHDTGEWEPIGPMTVSEDGRFICSDPGTGVIQPGWHGSGPPPHRPPNCQQVCCPEPGPPPGPNASKASRLIRRASGGSQFCLPCCNDTAYEACIKRCKSPLRDWLCKQYLEDCLVNSSDPLDCTRGPGCDKISKPDPCEDCKRCGSSSNAAVEREKRIVAHDIDATADQIGALFDQISRLADFGRSLPEPEREAVRIQIRDLRSQADSLAGGSALEFIRSLVSRLKAENELLLPALGIPVGNAPHRPVRYLANIRIGTKDIEVRGLTQPKGQYEVFLSRNVDLLTVTFFDPLTKQIARIGPLHPDGSPLPRFFLVETDSGYGDRDGDGVLDIVESVLGTSPTEVDSDGDGVSDGDEIARGTDPLDGQSAATGVVATSATSGIATDVAALDGLVAIADGSSGVSVFSAVAGENPLRLAQVPTAGEAVAVASSANFIAAAISDAGLAIIDTRNLANARVVQQVGRGALGGGSAHAVAAAAGLAFVGTTAGRIVVVELSSGAVFQILDLGARVEDVALEGTTLYAYAGDKLHVLPFSGGILERAGVVNCPSPIGINSANGRGRLFVGGGIAYATHAKGYNALDVRDPANPKLLSVGDSLQLGWKQTVANGSGRVLATVGANPPLNSSQNVSLYNSSDLTTGNMDAKFLTQFETPGAARAVTLYNGLAYVADHNMGLSVINYQPPDTAKKAPTGTLEQSVTGQVTIGGFVVLRAAVQDDVQVRNVEFFANGERVALDGNFPFETIYRVPIGSVGTSITFSALATDMGGNRLAITNTPLVTNGDDQPPKVTIESPTTGSSFALGDGLFVRVSAIDNVDGVAVADIRLELDGVPVAVRRLSRTDFQVTGSLARGSHTLRALATDFAGNVGQSIPVAFRAYAEAISREVSLYGAEERESGSEAISREVSVFDFGPIDSLPAEAVSREVSLQNDP